MVARRVWKLLEQAIRSPFDELRMSEWPRAASVVPLMLSLSKHEPAIHQRIDGLKNLGALIGLAALILLPAVPARAHHILGIPHYSYDERYPQTPVLTYRVDAGQHEVKMTGFPGVPKPGDRCFLHVYVRRLSDGEPFDDRVRLTVTEDRLIGSDPVIYGPIEAQLEEAVYKFHPQFGSEANYTARIEFEADGEPWMIDLPMVVGEPGSPWSVLAGVVACFAVFLLVIRALRIKMRRRSRGTASATAGPLPEAQA